MNRRTFATVLFGSVARPRTFWRQDTRKKAKTVFYSAVGGDLTLYSMNIEAASLTKVSTVTVPVNIQYAWPHPSKKYFYVVSSDGGPGLAGNRHVANAFRIDPPDGCTEFARPAAKLAVSTNPHEC
jgi:6-phosphogluconolactonase